MNSFLTQEEGSKRIASQERKNLLPTFQNALHDHNIPEENKESDEVGAKIRSPQPSHYHTSSPNVQRYKSNPNKELDRNPITLFYSGQPNSSEKMFDQNQFLVPMTLSADKPQDRNISFGKFFSEISISSQLTHSMQIWGTAPSVDEVELIISKCLSQNYSTKGPETLRDEIITEFQIVLQISDSNDKSLIGSRLKSNQSKTVLLSIQTVLEEKLDGLTINLPKENLKRVLVIDITSKLASECQEAEKKIEDVVRSNEPGLILEILRYKVGIVEAGKHNILKKYYEVLAEKEVLLNQLAQPNQYSDKISTNWQVAKQLLEEFQSKCRSQEEQSQELSERIKSLSLRCNQFQDTNQSLRMENERYLAELEKKKQDIDKYNAEIQQCYKKIDDSEKSNDLLRLEITQMKIQLSEKAYRTGCSEQQELITKDRQLDALREKVYHYQARANYLKFYLDIESNPVCEESAFKEQIQKLVELSKAHKELENKHEDVSEKLIEYHHQMAEKTKEFDKINKERSNLEKEAKNKIDELTNQTEQLKNDHKLKVESFEARLEVMRDELEEQKKINEKLKASNNEKEKQVQSMRRIHEELKSEIDRAEKEIIDLKSDIEYLEQSNTNIKEIKANLEKHLAAAKQKLADKTLENQLVSLKRKLEDAELERDQELTKNVELEEELDKIKKELQTAKDQLKDFRKQLSSKNQEILNLRGEILRLDDRNKELEQDVKELNHNFEEQEMAYIEKVKNANQSSTNQINQLNLLTDDLHKQNSELEGRISHMCAELQKHKELELELGLDLADLKKENRELKAANECLKEKLQKLNKQTLIIHQNNSNLKGEIQLLENENEKLNIQIKELKARVMTLEGDNINLQESNDALVEKFKANQNMQDTEEVLKATREQLIAINELLKQNSGTLNMVKEILTSTLKEDIQSKISSNLKKLLEIVSEPQINNKELKTMIESFFSKNQTIESFRKFNTD